MSEIQKITRLGALVLALLSLFGIALAGYSLYHFLGLRLGAFQGPSFCNLGGTFNCDQVNESAYSAFLGLPIASWGLLFYFFLLITIFLSRFERLLSAKESASLLLAQSALGALISCLLFFLSWFAIEALCLFCLATYLCNFAIFGLCLFFWKGKGLWNLTLQGLLRLALLPFSLLGIRPFPDLALSRSSALLGSFLGIFAVLLTVASPLFMAKVFFLQPGGKEVSSSSLSLEAWKNAKEFVIEQEGKGGAFQDYEKGAEDAPVHIVEFFDFECPACRVAYGNLERLLKKYPQSLRVTLKNFPLDQSCNALIPQPFHQHACFAAKYARCAGEQGRFWEVAGYLFELPEFQERAPYNELRAAIKRAEEVFRLDSEAIEECMANVRQDEVLERNIKEAERLEIRGTPLVLLNGKEQQDVSLAALERTIKHILSSR